MIEFRYEKKKMNQRTSEAEVAVRRCSSYFEKFTGKAPVMKSLFSKVEACISAALPKKGPHFGVFLCTLLKFSKQLSYRIPLVDCFSTIL